MWILLVRGLRNLGLTVPRGFFLMGDAVDGHLTLVFKIFYCSSSHQGCLLVICYVPVLLVITGSVAFAGEKGVVNLRSEHPSRRRSHWLLMEVGCLNWPLPQSLVGGNKGQHPKVRLTFRGES